MALDKNSNGFTFAFAGIMVIVVGLILALLYMGLKPMQEENVRREKMQNILAAINVHVPRDEAPTKYETMIVETYLLDPEGRRVDDDKDAFELNALRQFRLWRSGEVATADMRFPVFKAMRGDTSLFVAPVVGNGLWGPVWGYLSLLEDGVTVYGSTFDHKGETPGLGAEISTRWFQERFRNKRIVNDKGSYVGVRVVKPGQAEGDPHAVDGITGGTITSNGVDEMIVRTMEVYHMYFQGQGRQNLTQR
jgi:Na+-transporting NADH:ubiquinone oxidoreductase subunit C